MIKRSFVLICVLFMLAAGTALAADQPVTPADDVQPVLIAQQAETATGNTPATTDAKEETPAQPEEPIVAQNKKPAHVFGLGLGSYTPLEDEVKDTFGGTKIRVGLRPLLTETPKRMRFMYDVSFYSLQKDDDQALLIPLTVGVMQGFGQETKIQTYAAVNAGTFYGRVDAPSLLLSKRGWGFTANATVGLIYNKRLLLEARYEIMDEFAGFKFNSFSAMASYKMLQWRF